MPFFRAMWDFYRNVCGERRPFAVGETGAWNDNTKSPNSFKALRAWFFEALARGADSHLFFRWHKSLMGEEEHPAILPWSGRPGHAFRIIEEIARERVRLPEHLPLPECRTAILTGEVNGFLDKFIAEHPATKMLVRDSDILNRLGIVSDILPLENEQADWSPYKLLILPMMKHLPESAVEKLKKFAAAGGKILAQCRFHTVNDSGAYFEAPSPFEMKELMGFEIHESSPILEFNDWKEFKINTCAPPENNQELSAELFGESVHCYGWMEEAEIHGATTFGRYLEGCYQNAPLLLQRNGFFYQTAPLDVRGTELVLRHVLAEAGQETRREMLPEEVTLLRRGPVWFAINSSARKVKFEWNHEMICLEPYEICIKQAILPENGKKMMHREQNKTRLVAENLERKIRHAEWTPGMRLPSTRLLASEFECSTQVIVDAFDMLEQKRLVERKLRSGVFVRENPLFSNIEVGFLFSDTSQHKNNQFLNAMRRMADAPFLEPGFNFTLRSFSMPPHVNETVVHDELLRFIDRMNLDVLVLLPPFLSVKDVEFCRGLNIPVIFLGDFSDEASAMLPHHQISNDNFAYATIAFRKFASQISAAEVMLLSGSRQHYFYREFYEGFIHAANSTGIRVDLRELPIHFSNFSLAERSGPAGKRIADGRNHFATVSGKRIDPFQIPR